ncbi:hypothetical protein [Pelotomaculum propionicicum]|uniref:Uncharacterized protein n=1 Tax=Pelotomaculum propionicicum TaxID=258475 RepID=A0A4Y7RLG6_9FIRM|nr:hypothetical protein [Pelotomaculum propionicicum]NLI12915.1 hypothetical protein [Peptococcaceae bacterium]TEB09815.1 hypothetical protein Pmgp_02816 [Pelotomaculum propionicicum]
MKIFKKADEMEIHISFLSMRLAWVFMLLALLVWAWYDFSKYSKLNFAFYIGTVGGIFYWLSTIYYRNKMR